MAPARLDSPSTASSRSRRSAFAGGLELGAKALRCERAAGQLGQPGGDQIVDQLSRRVGKDRLAQRAGMDWKLGTDLENLKRGVRSEHVVDDDHARPVHDTDADRGRRSLGEALGIDDRAATKLVEVEVGVAEMQQAGTKLVLLRLTVLLDESVRLKRLQQSMHGGAGDLETVRKLAHTEAPRPAGERTQDPRSTDRRTGSFLSVRPVLASGVFGVWGLAYSALSNRLR